MSESGEDPRWLGPTAADLQDRIRILATEADQVQGFLRLTASPEWRGFIAHVQSRAEEVHRGLARADSWEATCRLQGRKQAYDWLLGFEDQQKVALSSLIEELQGYQERLEETT